MDGTAQLDLSAPGLLLFWLKTGLERENYVTVVRVVCGHDCPDMCSLLAHVKEGRVTRIEGDPRQPFTAGFACAKVNRDAQLVHSAERLLTPLRRKGSKGAGDFAPLTWDDALDEIVDRWQSIIRSEGPLAILGYAYSAHQGQINRGLANGFFHALGTSRLLAGTVCDTCCETAWEMTAGAVGGSDPETVTESELVIAWGCDLMATNVHFWAKLEQARKKGAMFIAIDPRRSSTASRADWHIAPRIGTDAALALGIMHILVRDGKCDRDYLAKLTLGFDRLEAEVLPRFAPPRTAEITGVPVADLERFADCYAKTRKSFIRIGEGMTRVAQGGQALRAVATLPALTGAYGVRGGGALVLTLGAFDLNYNAVRKPSGPAETRMINHSRLGSDLLELKDPPIRSLFIAANNPAVTCPEAGKVRKALAREDLFTIVHDPFMTDTARFADIVLPATTYLETEDFYRSYGTYYMQYGERAIEPVGEAWSNVRVVQALASRMGLRDDVFSMPESEILAKFFEGGRFGTNVREAGPLHIGCSDAQEFRTPSGKLEIYSETLEKQGIAPLPDWHPDPADEEASRRWPLRLLTAPSYFQPHTAFAANEFLRRREGEPVCILHPDDAQTRNLVDGSDVDLVNDRGTITLRLRVSDEVQRGVVLVPGQRGSRETRSGTVNMLCSDRLTDMGEGATYQSTWLEVRASR